MRFWKEPLVQFLVIGGLLFVGYTVFAPEAEPPREQIVVGALRIQSLEQSFEATWKRPPTASERQGLIDDFLVEEVFYREAQKLGLDQDDIVIRRRMRQKMEFLLQDGLAQTPLQETDLRAFFEQDPSRYRGQDLITFRQVYLGDGSDADADATVLLAQLNADDVAGVTDLGQRTMLPDRVELAGLPAIDGVFGVGFGQQLIELPTASWVGPIRSGFGVHLVIVDKVEQAPLPIFEEARADVERDFQYDQQIKATEAVVERLKQNYDILLDDPAK